jgi:CLIP-associating protein 1/2
MQAAVKDLRSQIGREACLTVAYIAYQLGIKCEFFMEPLIPTLVSLLVANAKVVTITGSATISIIYEYVPSWRLIPPLQAQMMSKSKEVRRAICSVLKIILTHWPHATIQKQAMPFHDIMKKGLSDADADARTMAREAFPLFQQSHPGLAQSILDSLEPLQKRQLMASINQTSSTLPKNTSLHRHNHNGSANPPTTTATPSLSRQGSMKRTNIPVLASRASPVKTATPAGRSTSAIDLQAAHRAKQQHFSTMR